MCGTGEYSISDFKSHHIANGNSAEFRRVLAWFWAGVSNFSQTEMARLLQFTTGCSQLPPGGFQELNPQFQITAAPTFGNLPTAHTWLVEITITTSLLPGISCQVYSPMTFLSSLQFQSTLFARLRELRAIWEIAVAGHQRGKWGFWHGLSQLFD